MLHRISTLVSQAYYTLRTTMDNRQVHGQVDWNQPNPKHLIVPCHEHSDLPHYGVITCLKLSKGRVFAASDDHTITMHAAETGDLIRTFEGHTGGIWDLAFPSDSVFVTAATDRTLRLWDTETGRNTHTFAGHTSTVRCIAVTELGGLPIILSGGRDNAVKVWRVPQVGQEEFHATGNDVTGNPYHIADLRGHEGCVRVLATHEGAVVSGSYDHDVRVWDLETKECRFVLKGHTQKGSRFSVSLLCDLFY